MNTKPVSFAALVAIACLAGFVSAAEKEAKNEKMLLADGHFELTVPDAWQRKQPRVNIIEYEYEVPAETGDGRPARVTVMGAGGSIEDNVNRWYGQFRQPDESDTSKAAKVEEKEIAGQKVTLVDVTGIYLDKPGGPFAGGQTVERENYRMLAAIVETSNKGKKTGNYFIKLIGPKQTVADSKKGFQQMIDSLKAK